MLSVLAAALLTTPAGEAMAQASPAVSGNPSATDYSVVGTGWLGRTLGLKDEWGIKLGGLWLADTNVVAAGGAQPGGWTNNQALFVGLSASIVTAVAFHVVGRHGADRLLAQRAPAHASSRGSAAA